MNASGNVLLFTDVEQLQKWASSSTARHPTGIMLIKIHRRDDVRHMRRLVLFNLDSRQFRKFAICKSFEATIKRGISDHSLAFRLPHNVTTEMSRAYGLDIVDTNPDSITFLRRC